MFQMRNRKACWLVRNLRPGDYLPTYLPTRIRVLPTQIRVISHRHPGGSHGGPHWLLPQYKLALQSLARRT